MDLQPTSTQKEIRELARKFARNEIKPLIDADESEARFRPELIQKLGALGLTGIPVAEEYSGMGLGFQEYIVAIEELARISAGYAISVSVTGLAQGILTQFGSSEQKKKYIPTLAEGKGIGSFSLSEAFSGSDAGALRTVAKKSGDHYVLNGTKLWTTQADSAKTILLMARTGEPGPKGISTFILEKGMPRLKFGKQEKKMGLHVSHTMEVILEDVKVPVENLVGKEGDGFKIAMMALDSGRITIAATAVGIATEALTIASRYAQEREQFGRPIEAFQGVSFLLADMATEITAARLLVQTVAQRKDLGLSYSIQAAMAKLFATDIAMKTTTNAVQVLGGAGYTQDFPVERLMREAKVLQIVEGTNQIQRVVIAKYLKSYLEENT